MDVEFHRLCFVKFTYLALRYDVHITRTHIHIHLKRKRETHVWQMSSYDESIQIESNRIEVQLNFQELTKTYGIQSNPPFCRLFSISFDLIGKLLSQNPSSFNTFETDGVFLFCFERDKSKKKTKTKKIYKRNFNKQELIKRKNNCFYQLLSSFSNAKQTRSSTDSHINVLACKREKENAFHTVKKWPGSSVQKDTGKCICEKSERKRPK